MSSFALTHHRHAWRGPVVRVLHLPFNLRLAYRTHSCSDCYKKKIIWRVK